MTKKAYVVAVLASLWLLGCNPNGTDAKEQDMSSDTLETDQQKLGYALGHDLARSLENAKDEIDTAALKRGIDDAFSGQEPLMDEKSREEVKTAVAKRLQEQAVKKHDEEAQANLDKGEAFLAENAKKDGVMTTDSGLQYEVMTAGEGDNPTAQDKVTVNYKGTLIDGTVFDSSYDRGEPVTFPLSNVIKGWTEGVQLMKPGAKYKFFIPSELAYGERGAGGRIGPNEALVFEVELLEVEKAAATE
ncbi:MAG: FKBP-type peptidyl-prolyl cis-trans isomerase [Gammaproteobacteria bacterium]|nr:FKBP-type peptidyl-prolyl cis-trans isomerase [Gammaproteobacteria bacterium]